MATISPQRIYDYIDKKVVGQEQAKRVVSASVFLHVVRYIECLEKQKPLQTKTNTLLMGPTGCGKTYIVRQASEAVQHLLQMPLCPMLEIDTTEITARGWEGENFVDLIRNHQKKYAKNAAEFASSIIFLDEIDKICKSGSDGKKREHDKATQYSLLKFIEGTVVEGPVAPIDTSKMMFILAGNFSEVRHNRELVDNKIGFVRQNDPEEILDAHQELDKMGMVSQLVGRVGTIGEVNNLTVDELRNIITNHTIPGYADTWKFLGRELYVPPSVVDELAENAHKRETGARGLASEVSKHLEAELFTMEFKI